MADVFISFATEDLEICKRTVEQIEALGWTAWYCSRFADNPAGGNWVERLADELMAATVVVLLYSKAANESKYVFKEVEFAVAWEKPILQIRLDESQPVPALHYLLRSIQSLNAINKSEGHWLIEAEQSLARWLRRPMRLPIDSVLNRQTKVEICLGVQRVVFGSQPVSMGGLGVELLNVVDRYLEQEHEVIRALAKLEHGCVRTAHIKHHDSFCVYPVKTKEGQFLILWQSVEPSRPERLDQILRKWREEMHRLTNEFSAIKLSLWEGSDISLSAEDPRVIVEEFFTRLGSREGTVLTNPGELPVYDRENAAGTVDHALLTKVASEIRDRSETRYLPRMITVSAAHAHMRDTHKFFNEHASTID